MLFTVSLLFFGCKTNDSYETLETVPKIEGLQYSHDLDLSYAEGFDVHYYKDNYKLIEVYETNDKYLIVPEGKDIPKNLLGDIQVIKGEPNSIYLAATAAMSLFDHLDSMDAIKMTGTKASGWYIDNAVSAMESGDMIFAGKYSEPDYELLLDMDCDLAIESLMITHVPKVKELLISLDIPVFTDCSSHEPHPLGRTEWIKLYGAILGKEDEAETFFSKQEEILNNIGDVPNTGKTVAFFYIKRNGTVDVRYKSDYIPKMIEIAGGEYVFSDLENDKGRGGSIGFTLEDFYTKARDADYLVYNSSIDRSVNSIEDLMTKSPLFSDFKAVKTGDVWTSEKSMYQATDLSAEIIGDFYKMLAEEPEEEIRYLRKLR